MGAVTDRVQCIPACANCGRPSNDLRPVYEDGFVEEPEYLCVSCEREAIEEHAASVPEVKAAKLIADREADYLDEEAAAFLEAFENNS